MQPVRQLARLLKPYGYVRSSQLPTPQSVRAGAIHALTHAFQQVNHAPEETWIVALGWPLDGGHEREALHEALHACFPDRQPNVLWEAWPQDLARLERDGSR
ncbi:MAG: hypothetical protein KTR31_23740 [Myxococcales bacterium]|nr:hypothetical protein [Myxococcales bacterium]